MNNDKPLLAARRAALIAECAAQRHEASREIEGFTTRTVLTGGGIGQYLNGRSLKLPLTIAGVVLGMVVAKPSRAMPLIATGLSLWKLAQSVLSVLRRPGV